MERTYNITVDLEPEITTQMNHGVLAQSSLFRAGPDVDVHFIRRIESDGPHFGGCLIAFFVLVSRRHLDGVGVFRYRELWRNTIIN